MDVSDKSKSLVENICWFTIVLVFLILIITSDAWAAAVTTAFMVTLAISILMIARKKE
jgi:hypothetical protein